MTETVTVIKKEPTCAELVEEQWQERQEDLKDPEYEALGFDYVAPHTWDDQPEGYWRWQFSWGGPSDELRGYVNEHGELHRLEYWYLDWGDGAHVLVDEQWQQRQEDLKDPEYEALGFDYVAPHTWDDQPEGYWRWQFSWGGPSDELRGYVNEHKELHRLEYWYLDWGDGASLLVDQDLSLIHI